MTAAHEPDTEELLCRAETGDGAAVQQLLDRHRPRLRRMLQVRLDPRLSARVDPSDIIQEAMVDASRKLPEYLAVRPLPFYPWLRDIAFRRLLDQHRRHVLAEKRAVTREAESLPLTDHSTMLLASQFVAAGSSPSRHMMQDELRARVRAALDQLDAKDREILVLRHLEQMPSSEIAALLKISIGAVKMRRLRAIERLRDVLDEPTGGQDP